MVPITMVTSEEIEHVHEGKFRQYDICLLFLQQEMFHLLS